MDDVSQVQWDAPPEQTVAAAPSPQMPTPNANAVQWDDEKPANVGETLAAGAEGAARGLAGPLAPIAEKLAGVTYKSQRERAEAHPIAHGVGETGALIGGLLTGTGEGALISGAGEAAAAAAGLGRASYAARIGSAAVGQAAEMAVMQGSDEVAKRILNDPGATAETAITNIGLASALGAGGGAFMEGALSPLWKATIGPQIESALSAATERFGGKEGATAATKAADLEAQTGIPIPNELRPVINDEPWAKHQHSILEQNDSTIAGRSYQKTVQKLKDDAAGKVVETLGRSPESLESIPELDKYGQGRSLGETLHSELKPEVEAVGKRYDSINDSFKEAKVDPAETAVAGDKITQYIQEQGLSKAESDASLNLANKVTQKLGQQETVADLKKFMTNLRDSHPYGSETYKTAKDLSNIVKDMQEQVITKHMGADALSGYQELRKDYSNLMTKIDGLNEHLHVGRYDGPNSFLNALKEHSTTNGERILNQLNGASKANVLEQLQQFPETLNKVKQYHVDSMLSKAVSKAGPGERINVNNLVKQINDASPQVKAIIGNPQQHQVIEGVGNILNGLKDPTHNWSNTARTAEKLAHGNPSVLSFIAAMAGHAEAGVLSFLGKLGFTEGRAALKLGMLKFMGSDRPVKAEGFKAMLGYLNAAHKGDTLITKSIGNVLKPGARVLLDSQLPKAAELAKIDKIAARQQDKPDVAMQAQSSGHLGHYMSDHQAAVSQSVAQVSQYLNSKRPVPIRPSPLDRPIEPTDAQKSAFQRTLTIAAAPATILEHIKNGTVKTTDLQDLKAMYPSLYNRMAQELSNHMINQHSDEEPIPYKTRMGLSLFLGQSIDSSMNPANIQAAQPQPQQGSQQPDQKPKGSPSKLKDKSVKAYETPDQAAQMDRTAGRTD